MCLLQKMNMNLLVSRNIFWKKNLIQSAKKVRLFQIINYFFQSPLFSLNFRIDYSQKNSLLV